MVYRHAVRVENGSGLLQPTRPVVLDPNSSQSYTRWHEKWRNEPDVWPRESIRNSTDTIQHMPNEPPRFRKEIREIALRFGRVFLRPIRSVRKTVNYSWLLSVTQKATSGLGVPPTSVHGARRRRIKRVPTYVSVRFVHGTAVTTTTIWRVKNKPRTFIATISVFVQWRRRWKKQTITIVEYIRYIYTAIAAFFIAIILTWEIPTEIAGVYGRRVREFRSATGKHTTDLWT